VVVVTGSGVSVQASSGMPNGMGAAASWKGLLRLAVECVDRQRKQPLRWDAAPLLAKLASDAVSTSDLLSVASTVDAALRKADAFRTFLDETIGQLEPAAPQVLHAVGQLGVPIATTNYDGLIEQTHELQPLTWQHPTYVDEWLKGAQPGVLHLHGHFRAVDSVVLGRESYKKTISDGHAQNVLRSLFQQRTLLFVGMGGGLDDPNFGALLTESWVELAATCSGGDVIHYKRSGPTACPAGGPSGPSASRARSVQGPAGPVADRLALDSPEPRGNPHRLHWPAHRSVAIFLSVHRRCSYPRFCQESQFFRVRTWDQDTIIDELLRNYDKLDAELRTELPFKRIWSLTTPEEE
jgi:hypothetical protein